MLRDWRERSLDDLLAEHDLTGAIESDFPNDGWSGATITALAPPVGGRRILKRTSLRQDWIARATRDEHLREGWVAAGGLALPDPVVTPYLGASTDGDGVAMLMTDLSETLIPWDRADGTPTVDVTTIDRVLGAVARLHEAHVGAIDHAFPWCPLRERILLLAPSSARRLADAGVVAGQRFLDGWAAFADQTPTREARDLIERLDADPVPLLDALAAAPPALLHGDLKLANVAPQPDGHVAFIDWAMVMVAPVAVELGWLLVSNSGALPTTPEETLERYRTVTTPDGSAEDWPLTVDLAVLVGLLLRGWRKGLDARAGTVLASGTHASDDLAWWSENAVEAARRRL